MRRRGEGNLGMGEYIVGTKNEKRKVSEGEWEDLNSILISREPILAQQASYESSFIVHE